MAWPVAGGDRRGPSTASRVAKGGNAPLSELGGRTRPAIKALLFSGGQPRQLRSTTRQAALVRTNAFAQAAKNFAGNDRALLAGEDARHSRSLRLDTSRDFFGQHAVCFVFSASTSRRQAQHAQGNDILCFETQLKKLEGQCKP